MHLSFRVRSSLDSVHHFLQSSRPSNLFFIETQISPRSQIFYSQASHLFPLVWRCLRTCQESQQNSCIQSSDLPMKIHTICPSIHFLQQYTPSSLNLEYYSHIWEAAPRTTLHPIDSVQKKAPLQCPTTEIPNISISSHFYS